MMPWDWPMMITGSAPKIRGSLPQFLVHRRFRRQHATQAEMMQFNVAARLSGAARHGGPKNNPAVLQVIVDGRFSWMSCSGRWSLKKFIQKSMKAPRILAVAAAAISLTSSALGDQYSDLVAKGYRRSTVDGLYACVSKDDVLRMVNNPFSPAGDEIQLKMVEQVKAYFLIPNDRSGDRGGSKLWAFKDSYGWDYSRSLDPNEISQQARHQGYIWSYRNSRNFGSHSDSDISNRRWSVAYA